MGNALVATAAGDGKHLEPKAIGDGGHLGPKATGDDGQRGLNATGDAGCFHGGAPLITGVGGEMPRIDAPGGVLCTTGVLTGE